jgi:hypothetical protein
MTKNYKIINDVKLLMEFIEWLPVLSVDEVYYVTLFARKKYCPDVPYIKTDKAQLKRFTASKKTLYDKIKQLEIEDGAYTYRGLKVPQESLALYITINPRSIVKATKNSLIKLAHLLTTTYNGYNLHQEIMSEIQKASSKKRYMSFDVDSAIIDDYKEKINQIINNDSVTYLKTRGGFHILVNLEMIDNKYTKTWYNNMLKLDGVDVVGDILTPVVGCTQGNFTPHFVK